MLALFLENPRLLLVCVLWIALIVVAVPNSLAGIFLRVSQDIFISGLIAHAIAQIFSLMIGAVISVSPFLVFRSALPVSLRLFFYPLYQLRCVCEASISLARPVFSCSGALFYLSIYIYV